jgi:hypothetical protein
LPWLIAALPAVCVPADPANTTDSGIVDAKGLWILENTPTRPGYFGYLVVHRRDGNVVGKPDQETVTAVAGCAMLGGGKFFGANGSDRQWPGAKVPVLSSL